MFASLAEGGQVRMPLAKTFFSSRFGMLADRFGVPWMIIVAPLTADCLLPANARGQSPVARFSGFSGLRSRPLSVPRH